MNGHLDIVWDDDSPKDYLLPAAFDELVRQITRQSDHSANAGKPGCWQDEYGVWHGRGWSMSDAMFRAISAKIGTNNPGG